MSNFTMSNEKKIGSFVYEEDLFSVKGNSKYDLETNKFDSADATIYREDEAIGFFNTYKHALTGEVKANINNVELTVLADVTRVVTACLASIDEYYNA